MSRSSADFESAASTNFTTSAHIVSQIMESGLIVKQKLTFYAIIKGDSYTETKTIITAIVHKCRHI